MRVLILSTQSRTDKTGVRVYCDALERGLSASGWCEVTRVCHHDAGAGWRRFSVLCLKCCRLLGRGAQQVLTRWLVALQTWRVLRGFRGRTDVVLAQDPITGAVAQGMGFRTWAVCHFSEPIEEIFRAVRMGAIARWFMRKTMRWFLRHNARYVALSETAAQMMRGYAPEARIEVIPTICRYDTFRTALPHEGFRVAMVGRLEFLKGQDRLIEALAFLRDVPVEVWLIGEGAGREALEKRTKELGVSDRVSFLGFVDDVAPILEQCDLYLHTSRMEAMALTPIEALFCGIPAWCFELPGYNDFHVFDATPRLPQTLGAEALAAEIRAFMGLSPEERARLLALQQTHAKVFQMNAVVSRYHDLFSEI